MIDLFLFILECIIFTSLSICSTKHVQRDLVVGYTDASISAIHHIFWMGIFVEGTGVSHYSPHRYSILTASCYLFVIYNYII